MSSFGRKIEVQLNFLILLLFSKALHIIIQTERSVFKINILLLLILWEQHRQRVFQNNIPEQIFGARGNETDERIKLPSLYCATDIIRVIKLKIFRPIGHIVRMKCGRSDLKIVTDTTLDLQEDLRFNGRKVLELI